MEMSVGLVLLSRIKFFSMTGDRYVNEKAAPGDPWFDHVLGFGLNGAK